MATLDWDKQRMEWVNEDSGWRLKRPTQDLPSGFIEKQRAAVTHLEDAKHHLDKLGEAMKEKNRARDA